MLVIDGQTDEAIGVLEAGTGYESYIGILGSLDDAYAVAGHADNPRATRGSVDAMPKESYVSPYTQALTQTAFGDKEAAFPSLKKHAETGTRCLLWTSTP